MRGYGLASTAAAVSLLASTVAAQVDPIVISGSKFFYKTNGTQFYIRGVAYQQDYNGNGTSGASTSSTNSYIDPLADYTSCSRDIPYLIQLRTNTIRVYAIDPTKDHSQCMNALANAGIYVISDLSSPTQSINRDTPSWNDELYARYTAVVDNMANYTNTLGFFAGNEVSNAPNNTDASAFVKAAVRDTKAYIKNSNYRTIGVGYATNDDAEIRVNMADYFNCGDASSAIDFWGYNIYSWCGDSSYTKSGYDVRTQEFSTYSVPAFFAEYGCNDVEPRTFTEVGALYGSNMSSVWSGGIVYMYFQEANNYGLVSVSGNSVTPNQDFKNLASEIASATPSGVQSASYKPSNSAASCPATGSTWAAVATPLPPSPNKELCTCMYNSLGCVVAPATNQDNYGTLFGTVCGYGGTVCDGIAANASTGTYGAYGMCNATEQLGYAFNQYYGAQSSSASACAFSGAAQTKSPSSASGACASLISQAGTAGTGTVTSAPSGSGGSGSGGSSGSSGSGASGSASKGAAGLSRQAAVETGLLPVALMVCVAAVSGMGMILL
ncbi:hypothetical protein LTR35_014804 [Friedmanniomyces endolithicus]|uniref:1,3-beta-glucanosyltransferase n=1 Tax=Friedmanniomyces endolithicus TaxID=329885 RepID=A0AAN6FE23_9PEZI|nr:hypothetical protein LTR35_014804 [Friedmanniomyces endolithicus]KAK0279223.1 hypothetical protein LTS00_013496 [Friedmanniomyces endolithicus]KAK0311704.1 hypothetical protein LTR82_014233 [Friedmanniomyces endolithicus]KAK0984545.1 hypothetical protein LTR54_014043 [Friedmanniomyces endolithicus]